MHKFNELNQFIKYTSLNLVSVQDQITYRHHTPGHSDHLNDTHTSQATIVQRHHINYCLSDSEEGS